MGYNIYKIILISRLYQQCGVKAIEGIAIKKWIALFEVHDKK